uniref:Uncharacterized protein n=1 Tax=Anopheles minimus TaxID=112268 RepID=A0A182VY92_9DIPT
MWSQPVEPRQSCNGASVVKGCTCERLLFPKTMDWGERTIVEDQQSVDGLRPDMRHEPPAHQQQHLLQQPLQQPLLQPVQQLHTYMPQSTTPSQLPPPLHSPLSLAIPISDALRHRT